MRQISSFTDPSSPIARPELTGKGAVFERLARTFASERMVLLVLAVVIAVALLAPLGPLVDNRFHRDEAVYSSWGLDIASGRDLLVSGSPVDKPPLFLYTQALSFLLFGPTEVAARLPSLVASLVSVGLVYALGRSLYERGAGLLAAFLVAASPFVILFAPTAFTDPLMVMWVLAACLATVRGRWVWGGVFLGLAAITKQQGVFFVPLAVGLGLGASQQISKSASQQVSESASQQIGESANHGSRITDRGSRITDHGTQITDHGSRITNHGSQISNPQSASLKSQVVGFAVAFLVVFCLAILWDVGRARQPGFLAQSLVSYGGLALSPGAIWERLLGFGGLLRYGTGSPVLNGVLLIGVPLLLVVDFLFLLGGSEGAGRWGTRSQALADLILAGFVVLFLVGHSLVAFAVWDRYLLGLIPLLALLLARVLTLPYRLLKGSPLSVLLSLLFALWMLAFTFRPLRDAAASRFPIGGDHGAYQGIGQVVGYFQTVPSDTTLYHRWLGWHWRFYLWGNGYDLPAWTSSADLANQAAARPGARRYVVFPSWRSSTEAQLALSETGLVMREVHRAFRDDGSISFVVYRIEEAP